MQEYLTEIQERGSAAGATPTEILSACLNGVLPQLRAFLAHHDVSSVDDLRKWSAQFEIFNPVHEQVTSDIDQLSKKLDSLVETKQINSLVTETSSARRHASRFRRRKAACQPL